MNLVFSPRGDGEPWEGLEQGRGRVTSGAWGRGSCWPQSQQALFIPHCLYPGRQTSLESGPTHRQIIERYKIRSPGMRVLAVHTEWGRSQARARDLKCFQSPSAAPAGPLPLSRAGWDAGCGRLSLLLFPSHLPRFFPALSCLLLSPPFVCLYHSLISLSPCPAILPCPHLPLPLSPPHTVL